jgi:hypothetical protein
MKFGEHILKNEFVACGYHSEGRQTLLFRQAFVFIKKNK